MTASTLTRRARRRRRETVITASRTALLGLLVLGVAQGVSVHGAPAAPGPVELAIADTSDGAAESDTLRESLDSSRSADRAGTLTLIVDGTTTSLPLAGETVGETLAEAGVVVDGDDLVSPHLSEDATDGLEVTISRVETAIVTEDAASGADSNQRHTYEVTTVDGVEVSRVILAASETLGDLDAALAAGDNVEVGRLIAAQHGWSGSQWQCLYNLWQKESRWLTTADNPTSSAYGIPQALPGRKMASAGDDWATNPATQVTWGIGYIEDRYGSPCAAWGHSQSHNWY